MSKESLRVYFVRHEDGRYTGILLRTWDWAMDSPPPSAYGVSEDDVLAQLEREVHAIAARGDHAMARYLWDESFQVRTAPVDVHPQTSVKKRAVIGKRRIPLVLSYLASRVPGGGHRILVPRFGWRFIVEDLSIAADVLRQAVSTALVGESGRSIYDFRQEGDEYVREWSPRLHRSASLAAQREEDPFPTLRAVAEELVEKAGRGKLPPILGASPELASAASLFDRDPPASILIVGAPGVGKTTFVHRMARRFLAQRRDKARENVPRLWSTSTDRILAGMKYLGMWQERCLSMARELSHEGDYLYVGNLLPLLRAQPDGTSIADVFGASVRSGEVSLVAECTEPELETAERRAATFVSSFRIIRLHEPVAAEVPALLHEYEARKSPRFHLHPAGKKRLVVHLSMFRRDTAFPGKALRFYDWLDQESDARAPKDAPPRAPKELYPRDVSEAYARYSGLPVELIADEVPASAASLAERLQRRVIGQDRACAVAARVLSRFKAGLDDPERPVGTLLFVGPTGVGKTELAKALSRTLFGDEARMIRLDMSEYMRPGAADRLLEVGPGVSSLAQRVRQEPLSLVLFDEIEKAHREVFDVLLAILGEGRLTDEEGRLVDFRMTFIVMTSNLGVADTRTVGFGDGVDPGASIAKVREHFRPELVNRIDHVIPFRRLDRADVLSIVDLELAKAQARTGLVRRGLRLTVTDAAKELLAELGYDPTRGARPLVRVIEERVITPLAARMAADAAFEDREVVVDAVSGEIVVR
ncbi:ATP-dependent Clp protease ATP-binding subunit ClpA [Minicystis rosea]|nr:ATP-dependent Clp protease ATP-binding subunit ClpA [Minicystis rosea]